jgi:hypothetical protein
VGPAADAILTAWESAGPCPYHVVPLLEDRKDNRRSAAVEASCRRLTCPNCIKRRRGTWLTHFAGLIEDAVASAKLLYLLHIDPGARWLTVQRAIQRLHGDFARVETFSGMVIVTTAPLSDPLSGYLAVEALAAALADLAVQRGGKPVSTSAAWRLNERRRGRYRCRGLAPRGTFRAIMQRALEASMPPKVWTSEAGKCGGWTFPDDWDEDARAAFFAELTANPHLRNREARVAGQAG